MLTRVLKALGDRGKSRGNPYTQNHMERQGTPCSLLLPEEPPTQLASENLCLKEARNKKDAGRNLAVPYTLCQEERDTGRTA